MRLVASFMPTLMMWQALPKAQLGWPLSLIQTAALTGGLKSITYSVLGGDTLSTIATKFAAQITADTDMQANGINASANGTVMSIKFASPNITCYSQSTSGGATETITLGVTGNFVENAVIGGTKTTGNTVTITVSDAALSGGQTAITYTVLAADTLTTIATGLSADGQGKFSTRFRLELLSAR